jgi:hypothetical protein
MERTHIAEQTWVFVGIGALATLAILLFLFAPPTLPPSAPIHEGHHQHQGMLMNEGMANTALQSKLRADKKESEFNHHLAGFFVLLAGACLLLQPVLVKRWPAVKYVWPTCFVIAGLFVLVWSDTELWPFGHRQWLEALRNNSEVLQHKIFALLLLGLGVIEWQRVRGTLKALWSDWVYPVAAIGGSILLLFHSHETGMHDPNHMEVMSRIHWEHLSYTVTGVCLGLAKGLAETKVPRSQVFRKWWPLLMMVLGVLLMFYRE